MGCRNRDFPGDDNSSSSFSDALLFATLCLIGLPVDVHVKGGSVYSGIFHTASVENDYGIILKKARMTKRGKCKSNIANGEVVDTLVILSGDLVQLVAKEVLLPADGDAGNMVGNVAEAVVDAVASEKFIENDVPKSIKSISETKSAVDLKRIKQIRNLVQNENGFTQGFMPTNARKDHQGRNLSEIRESSGVAVDGRECGDDGLQGEKTDDRQKLEFPQEESAIKVLGPSSSLDNCVTQIKTVKERPTTMAEKSNGGSCDPPLLQKMENQIFERSTSPDACLYCVSLGASTSTSPVVDVTSEFQHSSVATPTETIIPHVLQSNRSAKESKLNPGAKMFSPSFTNPVSATSAVQAVAAIGYMPNNSPVIPVAAALPEAGLSPFGSHSSLPVKILPYGNFPPANVGTAQFPQRIVGNVGRTQPLGYAGWYPMQPGPGIATSSSHSELVQGVTTISSPFAPRPFLTTYQVQFPKHQGTAGSQAMQPRVAPHLIVSGQQPYAMPCHIPVLQQPLHSNRYIHVPGSNGFFNSKFL